MNAWIVLGIALLLVVPAAIDAATKPNLRRLAWRNLWRRKSEAALVTLGTLLGTAIIVASFVVGATIEDAGLSRVDNVLGPLDEAVVIEDPTQLDVLTAAIEAADLTDVDGVVPILSMPTVMTTTGDDPLGKPSVWFAEIDFDDARAFGADVDATGFADAGPTPEAGEIVLTERIATPLDIEAGDVVVIHAYGTSTEFTVSRIIDRSGLAGWNSGYVAPGTIFEMYDADNPIAARPPRAEVVISNTGDNFEGAVLTEGVVEQLKLATGHLEGVTYDEVKQETITDSEKDGSEFTTLFSGIGSFAVIAGILLIVNLFVMLAEERKTQLGILRAIGFRRHQVTRAFGIEGTMYAFTATIAGTMFGIGIGWVLVQAIKFIFPDANDFLDIGFSAPVDKLMLGAAIGLGLSMITIWVTAIRIARFNVIAAIRDLPNPPPKSHKLRTTLLSLAGIAAGVGLTFIGFDQEKQIPFLAGPGLIIFALIPVLRLIMPSSIGASLMGLAAIGWGALAFTIFPDLLGNSSIAVFVVQGIILVTGAIIISSSAQRLWTAAVNGLASVGMGLATRLGLAYPMARRVRTGLLLGMFSLVIFTVTFLSVFSGILAQQTQSFADDIRAGNDLIVRTSSVNPVSADEIVSLEGVSSAAAFVQAFPEFEVADDETDSWRITGFDESLFTLGTPNLGERADQYQSDQEVFEAVLADPTLIIVNDFFLDSGDDPGGPSVAVGDPVVMLNEVTGETQTLEIVGIMASDFLFAGSYVGEEFAKEFMGPLARPGLFFVASEQGADPSNVASRINAALISNGAEAVTFDAEVAEAVSGTLGIFRLFQGFLSLGLFIGVAGLAVVLIRAVRERRRSIGVLRALGYSEKTVRSAFLIEAGFIAVQGVAIGIGLGLLTAYQVLVNSDTFGDSDFSFVWPWVALSVILVLPTLAALAAAVGPAIRASRISPAVALRTD